MERSLALVVSVVTAFPLTEGYVAQLPDSLIWSCFIRAFFISCFPIPSQPEATQGTRLPPEVLTFPDLALSGPEVCWRRLISPLQGSAVQTPAHVSTGVCCSVFLHLI